MALDAGAADANFPPSRPGRLKKNTRTMTSKMEKKKYDPVARKHVVFREAKIK